MGVKKWKCDQCDYAAGQKGNLTQHVKSVQDKVKDH
jgi:KRAB domain-containing zinc finger protein